MCFDQDHADCAWHAEIQDITEGPSAIESHCVECSEPIHMGDQRKRVYQQQHECCQTCDERDEDDPLCEMHDYGEIYEVDICESCSKILKAIEEVEADAGCPPYARQPLFGELKKAILNDTDNRYAKRAIEMFPELSEVEWLAKRLT